MDSPSPSMNINDNKEQQDTSQTEETANDDDMHDASDKSGSDEAPGPDASMPDDQSPDALGGQIPTPPPSLAQKKIKSKL